jgi:hypothetical protein
VDIGDSYCTAGGQCAKTLSLNGNAGAGPLLRSKILDTGAGTAGVVRLCIVLVALPKKFESRLGPQRRPGKASPTAIDGNLINSFRRLVPARQLFGFLVSLSNPTDINNSVPRAELQVTYLIGDVKAVCRIQHDSELAHNAIQNAGSATVLTLPARVDAHQTITGWLLFALDNDLIHKGTIDAHSLLLEDTHGVTLRDILRRLSHIEPASDSMVRLSLI